MAPNDLVVLTNGACVLYLLRQPQAIGLRNLVESEVEDRARKKRALQAQINEKMAELERWVMTTGVAASWLSSVIVNIGIIIIIHHHHLHRLVHPLLLMVTITPLPPRLIIIITLPSA
jgi:hypothetical protein